MFTLELSTCGFMTPLSARSSTWICGRMLPIKAVAFTRSMIFLLSGYHFWRSVSRNPWIACCCLDETLILLWKRIYINLHQTYIIPMIEFVTQSLHIRIDFGEQCFLLRFRQKILDDQHVTQKVLLFLRRPILLEMDIVDQRSIFRLISSCCGAILRGKF